MNTGATLTPTLSQKEREEDRADFGATLTPALSQKKREEYLLGAGC